ncbi:hypothetical protein Tco_1005317 [Tanacetum coccineum]|uniref:Uncharacterized protein n=1 Tax=Tanacetum coccineum TaxID=301880 RepID=A0ABQ5FF38_9ASTR
MATFSCAKLEKGCQNPFIIAIVYNDALTSEPEVSSDFENEFPAIVYNDALTSEAEVSSEPMVRISQKSQENSHKQANTDTRIRRVQKEAKDPKP